MNGAHVRLARRVVVSHVPRTTYDHSPGNMRMHSSTSNLKNSALLVGVDFGVGVSVLVDGDLRQVKEARRSRDGRVAAAPEREEVAALVGPAVGPVHGPDLVDDRLTSPAMRRDLRSASQPPSQAQAFYSQGGGRRSEAHRSEGDRLVSAGHHINPSAEWTHIFSVIYCFFLSTDSFGIG